MPTDPPSLVNTPEPQPKVTPPEPSPEEAPAAPEPLTWETINLPEGFTVDEKSRDSFLEIMNDDKLSGAERAQKLVDLQTGLMQQMAEANFKAWTDLQTQWQDEIRADPEIGGDKLDPALGGIAKLVDRYGSKELREAMDATGAGNNPHIIRFLHKIAKDLNEGGPVLGAPSESKESLADRMYPSMKKQGA